MRFPLFAEHPAWRSARPAVPWYPELWNFVGGQAIDSSRVGCEGGKVQVLRSNAGTSRPTPWTRGSGDEGERVSPVGVHGTVGGSDCTRGRRKLGCVRGGDQASTRGNGCAGDSMPCVVHEPGPARGCRKAWTGLPWVPAQGGLGVTSNRVGGHQAHPRGLRSSLSSAGQREAARSQEVSKRVPSEPSCGGTRRGCAALGVRGGSPHQLAGLGLTGGR